MFLFLPFPMAKARADQSDREGETEKGRAKEKEKTFPHFFPFFSRGGSGKLSWASFDAFSRAERLSRSSSRKKKRQCTL